MFSPPGPRVRRTPFVLQTTVRRGLIHRVFGAWVLLAVIVEGRDTALHSRHYRVVHSAADRLERFVIDLETATRGFLPDWRGALPRAVHPTREQASHVSIHDDGIDGADPARGARLIGLTDRVEALAGTITVTSPPDLGTFVQVELRLDNDLPPAPPLAQGRE